IMRNSFLLIVFIGCVASSAEIFYTGSGRLVGYFALARAGSGRERRGPERNPAPQSQTSVGGPVARPRGAHQQGQRRRRGIFTDSTVLFQRAAPLGGDVRAGVSRS